MALDWSILAPANSTNYAGIVDSGIQRGRALRDRRDTESALRDYSVDPQNPSALAFITSKNPEVGFKLQDRAREEATRNALGIALGGGASPAPSAFAASQPAPAGASAFATPGEAPEFGSLRHGGPTPPSGGGAPRTVSEAQVMAPEPAQAAAMREVARLNPELYMKLRKMTAEDRKAAGQALTEHMELAGRAYQGVMAVPPEQRPQVYQQIRAELMQAGVSDLPEAWDENAARTRIQMGMKVSEALTAERQDRRLEWDVQDDKADNARADESLDVTRRGQDLSHDDRVRGQDLSHDDRVRGQDLGHGDRQTALRKRVVSHVINDKGEPVNVYADGTVQPIRNARPATGGGKRSGISFGGGGGDLIGPVKTDGKRRIQFSKSKAEWVDLATGKPIQ
jgi:hypothetical protein